jgi:major membrane immunogen (membrane-anchored lipoprotein)
MKILTGFAVINNRNGKMISYTYDTVDEKGNLKDSNNKESFVVLEGEEELKTAVEGLEQLVEKRMNEED